MGSSAKTPADPGMFQAALPIYKTSDRFGTTIPTASAVTTGIEYAVQTNGSHFDDSSTSLTPGPDATGYTYSTWSGSQDESLLSGYGANSIHVLRAVDGKARTWHVSTDTTDRYLWTSGDGQNWASKGGYYDTDGSTQTVISKYLGWAGGSNSSTTSVSASPVPEVAGDPLGAYLSLAVPMHGVHNGMTFPDHAYDLNPSLSGRTLINSGGYTRNTHPANYYGTSGYFSSGNDFLTIPCDSSTAFAEGEDFTIEFWMAHPGTFGTGSIHPSILTLAPLQIYRNSNGTIALYHSSDKAGFDYDPDPSWNHFAWVRKDGVIYGYLNGQLKAQTAFNDATGRSSGDGYIGKYPGGAGLGGAYLSDFRIYKGVAKYTSNFEVPNQVDGQDLSGNTNNGAVVGPSWQTTVSKYYDGAARFLANSNSPVATSGDKITVDGSNGDFTFGTGDFSVEFWYMADPSEPNISYNALIGNIAGSAAGYWRIGSNYNNTNILWFTYTSGSYNDVNSSVAIMDNSWHHIAATRESGLLRLFVDGSVVKSATVTQDLTQTTDLNIMYSAQQPGYASGYMQDVRIYKGIAKYTSTFEPPKRSVQGTSRRHPSGIYVIS